MLEGWDWGKCSKRLEGAQEGGTRCKACSVAIEGGTTITFNLLSPFPIVSFSIFVFLYFCHLKKVGQQLHPIFSITLNHIEI